MHIAAIYESVTQPICAKLKGGTAPWVKPWKAGKSVGIMPATAISGHHYRAMNVVILWLAADKRGFPTSGWLAFKQALDAGGHVRKGEKGAQIVFTKRISVTDNGYEERPISMLRAAKLHELVHRSGSEKRVKRDLKNRFGTKAYAAEEFIAEPGAAFLCAHLGAEGQPRHAEYKLVVAPQRRRP